MAKRRSSNLPVMTATGQDYGAAKTQADTQKAVPLPDNREPRQASGPTSAAPATVGRPDVFGPSTRPAEPVTAGAGAGPGPGQLGMLPEDTAGILRHLVVSGLGTPAIRRLLERAVR